MKLVTFEASGAIKPGVFQANSRNIVDLTALMPTISDLNNLIDAGPEGLSALRESIVAPPNDAIYSIDHVKLLAPIRKPARNIFCVGKNYYDHAEEFHQSGFDASAGKNAVPDCPIFFSKSHTSIIGPGEFIPATDDWTNSVDYEVELAVVIGSGGRRIQKSDAYNHVFGYTIINDVTSRTLQQQHKQWFLGKNFDGFCPMGPWLVTADEVGDVEKLSVSTHVNGELRQSAMVKDLIFDIPTLIADLSAVMTLQPGDIIATGTPAGVGLGFDPPRFMAAGDTVTLSIDKLGVLENPVA